MISSILLGNIAELLALYTTTAKIETILTKIGVPNQRKEGEKPSKLALVQKGLNYLHESNNLNEQKLTIILNEFTSSEVQHNNDQQKADIIIQEIKNEIEQYNLALYSCSIFYISETQIQLTLDDSLKELNISVISEYFNESYNNIATKPSNAVISAAKLLEAILKYYIKETDIVYKHPQYEIMTLNKLINITKTNLGINGKEDPVSVGIQQALNSIGKIRNEKSHGQIKIQGTPLTSIQSRLIVNAIHSIVIFILETLKQQRKYQ